MKEHLVLAQEGLNMAGICWHFCNTTSEPKQRTKIQCFFWKDASLRLAKWISSFIPIEVGTELWFFKNMHIRTCKRRHVMHAHVHIYTHMYGFLQLPIRGTIEWIQHVKRGISSPTPGECTSHLFLAFYPVQLDTILPCYCSLLNRVCASPFLLHRAKILSNKLLNQMF